MPSMLFAVDFSIKEAFYIPWTTAAQMALASMLLESGVPRTDLKDTH